MWTDNPTLHVNRILEHFAKIDSRYKTVLVAKPGKSPFSDTLLARRGTKRAYFSKDPDEVYNSGKNINVHRIPGTDWFACTHFSVDQKHRILYGLLCTLGFSAEYSRIISWLPLDRRPRIRGFMIG